MSDGFAWDGGSLTARLGAEALSAMLGKAIKAFHLVAYRDYAVPRTHGVPDLKSQSSDSKQARPLLYLCFSAHEFHLVDVEQTAFSRLDSFVNSRSRSTTQKRTGPPPCELLRLPYTAIANVVADAEREDFFDLTLHAESLSELKVTGKVPERLVLCSMHRKTIVEHLQICWATAVMTATSQVASLPVRWVNDKSEDSVHYKHPVERFYRVRLPASNLRERTIFHRAGYVFLAPSMLVDKYAQLRNRPFSTYVARQTEGDNDSKQARLVVRFMPPQAISEFSNICRARDVRGQNPEPIVDTSDLDPEGARLLFNQQSLMSSPQQKQMQLQQHQQLFLQGGLDTKYANAGSDVNPGAAKERHSLESLSYGREYSSDTDFQLWVETAAMSIAMADAGKTVSKDFFVPSRGVYNKKMNVVGDKSAWSCFRLHIHTRRREIGVIGVRRKYLPPYLDTYQDMLFVLYGKRQDRAVVKPVKHFMAPLDELVDSLSPAVAPMPFLESLRVEIKEDIAPQPDSTDSAPNSPSPDGKRGGNLTNGMNGNASSLNGTPPSSDVNSVPRISMPSTRTVHLTYIDRKLAQARADSLLYDQQSFAWLNVRTWIRNAGSTGIRPETRFIDMECVQLAEKFVNSVRAKLPRDGGQGEEDLTSPDSKRNAQQRGRTVDDPLSILFRMQAELSSEAAGAQYENDGSFRNASSKGLGLGSNSQLSSGLGGSSSTQSEAQIQAEEWKCRVSRYLAHCVDGGIDPAFTLSKLAETVEAMSIIVQDNSQELQSIDQVLDFLIYFKPKSTGDRAAVFTATASLVEKLKYPGMLTSFTCNELVITKLLRTTYIEDLIKRKLKSDDPPDLLPRFLAALLSKDYNSDLIQAVCDKIATLGLWDPVLLPPLIQLTKTGTLYAKTFAFQALSGPMAVQQRLALFQFGAVGLAVWHIYVTKSAPLLQSCVEFIAAVIPPKVQADDVIARPDFPKQLVQLLQVRVPYETTKGKEQRTAEFRYPAGLLSAVSTLLIHMTRNALETQVLEVLYNYGCVDELVGILSCYKDYHAILTQISHALGLVLLNGGVKILMIDALKLKTHCRVLMSVLSQYSTTQSLELCMYILISMRIFCKFEGIPSSTKDFEGRLNERLEALKHLSDDGLGDILHRCKLAAGALMAELERTTKNLEERKYSMDGSGQTGSAAHKVKTIRGVVKKVQWFESNIQKCKELFKGIPVWDITSLAQDQAQDLLAEMSKE